MSTLMKRVSVCIAVCLALTLGLSACTGGSGGSTSKAATAKSLADFGTMADLEAAAKAEKKLNVIALPHDWANYGKIIDGFKAKYPEIAITEDNPDGSSAEEIQAAKTNKGLDNAPDVFDLGMAVGMSNTAMFAPYKVATWADIPDTIKEASGLYTGDYGGYTSFGYDSSKVTAPATMDDLLKPAYKGMVAINGDPTQAQAALGAIGLATLQHGGTLDDFTPGINFFQQLNQAGNFLKVNVTTATIDSGETPAVFDWDYLNATHTAKNPNWKVMIFPGKGFASYYLFAINADAPHPAAARLWAEYLFSDDVQNLFLNGGARPSRMEAMTKAGTIDKAAADKLPPTPAEPIMPTLKQNTDAGTLLGQKWAAAVG